MNPNFRNFALWVIIFLLVVALVMLFNNPGQKTNPQEITFSELLKNVDASRVRDVTISGPEITGHFTDNRLFTTYSPSDPTLVESLYKKNVAISCQSAVGRQFLADHAARQRPAAARLPGAVDLRLAPDAGGRRESHGLRQVEGQAADRGARSRDVRGRRRRRRGEGGPAGDRRVPARSAEVPAARRPHPARRSAGRAARHGQDAARPRHRRRGERSVLHDLGLRLRRDVRRRRREPRARHVRAGQEERALHHLHRRDRRGRPPSRRRISAAATTSASRR